MFWNKKKEMNPIDQKTMDILNDEIKNIQEKIQYLKSIQGGEPDMAFKIMQPEAPKVKPKTEKVEAKEEEEFEEEKPQKPKEVIEVVSKLPVQEVRRVRRDDGVIVNFITTEEYLTRMANNE